MLGGRSIPNLTRVVRGSRRYVTPSVLAAVFLLSGGTARAAAIIDFGIVEPSTGVVTYLGLGGPLTGIGIQVDFLTGSGTPANGGSYGCIDCVLNFQTGDLIGAGANGWAFAGGFGSSVITITGGVDTDGDSTADIGGEGVLLMFGSFIGPQVTVDLLPENPLLAGLSVGMFLDVKNADLTAFFGLPPRPYSGDMTLGLFGLGDPPGAFRAEATNGLVRNTFVPEPGSTLLLGAGLLLLLARRQRRV